MSKRIAIYGYPGAAALDIVGPAEVFACASAQAGLDEAPYRVEVVADVAGPFATESGLMLMAAADEPGASYDTLIVPGGAAVRDEAVCARAVSWIRRHERSARRVVSVCTGLYALAASGLLQGRRAATHWRFAADVARRYPATSVEPEAIFVKDGRYYASAGVTAGIDLTLALVEEDLGPRAALAVARELVVYLRRQGGQSQFSEPLSFQTRSIDRFADLAAWIATHLSQDLSVEALADRSGVGRRHFSRVFTAAYGEPPARYVERLRMAEAARRLAEQPASIEAVAASVGYRKVDVFRRAFERAFAIGPAAYRQRFGTRVTA